LTRKKNKTLKNLEVLLDSLFEIRAELDKRHPERDYTNDTIIRLQIGYKEITGKYYNPKVITEDRNV